jgi:hypothetical protein
MNLHRRWFIGTASIWIAGQVAGYGARRVGFCMGQEAGLYAADVVETMKHCVDEWFFGIV